MLRDSALGAGRGGGTGVVLRTEAVIDNDHGGLRWVGSSDAREHTPTGIGRQSPHGSRSQSLQSRWPSGYHTPLGISIRTRSRAMAVIKLVCQRCRSVSAISTSGAIKDEQKRCLECGCPQVRQTLGSFLSNGPLSSPTCGVAPAGG